MATLLQPDPLRIELKEELHMAKRMSEVAVELATTLITSAGLAHAVHTTDIAAAVRNLNSRGESYPQSQLEDLVKKEIGQRHPPGISG